MPLVNAAELDHIDLGGGEWAKIKRQMSFGDFTRLEDEMARIRLKRLPENGELTQDDFEAIEIKGGKLLLLELNVVEWNVQGADGKVAPLTRQSFEQLDMGQANLLLSEIDRRNPGKKAARRPSTKAA